ncbi:ATP-binding protein [Tumidithrix elongata RA019]|uniref:ATP-binding protein n=1 Tax=Tumidithrix elongata BACA0141 TaxID=2716417 RepID=A0AAW9Q752_9CYAN|nr:ATP-binding protein [Tumidithrix elongata RA019]
MLVDFTVENFRSIKGAETLSAVAQKKKANLTSNGEGRRRVKSDDEIALPYHVEGWDLDILPVLAIFGANASGKSNIVVALDYLLTFMRFGNSENDSHHNRLIPFRLDKLSAESPTRFELRTVFNGTIYTYHLELDRTRILSEKLDYAQASSKRDRCLFHRVWNQDLKKFDWKNGRDFKGSHTQLETSVNNQEPFMSLLMRLEVKIIEPLSNWLNVRSIGTSLGYQDELFDRWLFSRLAHKYPEFISKKASELLCKFDTGISGFEIKKSEDNKDDYQIYAIHHTKDGDIHWPFEEESMGTQRLFGIAHRIHQAFSADSLVIIDELGSNVHPNVTRAIVRLFQNPKTNPNRSQLIFTSHDNTIQKNNLLRRDQIWFTQKRSDQSTELYSLSDFKVRNDLAIEKAYLDGRFGAVPFIPEDEELI